MSLKNKKIFMTENNVDICIISPALLETGTKRGGGCEVTDYHVALQLSKYFNVAILSTFYRNYVKTIKVNEHFSIEEVPFPAQKNYPPRSRLESYIALLSTYFYSILVAIKVMGLIKKNLKIIVVHNPQTAMPSVLLAKIMKIKIIYAEGNTTPWTNPYININTPKMTLLQKSLHFFNFNLTKLMCKLADQIRAQSNSIKEGMVGYGIDPAKIKVIPAGVDANKFTPNNKIGGHHNSIKIGFIGRLTEIKGVLLLLEVVRKAVTELPDASFLIFGEGPYRQYFTDLPNVEHLGFVHRDELNLWLSKVQITLFFQKELGRAELEAMASGKAIVACDLGEVSQTLKHLENGILCAPDARSYITAIKRLCEDPSLIESLSRKARETAVKCFSWDAIGCDWFSLCVECLKEEGTV